MLPIENWSVIWYILRLYQNNLKMLGCKSYQFVQFDVNPQYGVISLFHGMLTIKGAYRCPPLGRVCRRYSQCYTSSI